jgi:hypothetical protein
MFYESDDFSQQDENETKFNIGISIPFPQNGFFVTYWPTIIQDTIQHLQTGRRNNQFQKKSSNLGVS